MNQGYKFLGYRLRNTCYWKKYNMFFQVFTVFIMTFVAFLCFSCFFKALLILVIILDDIFFFLFSVIGHFLYHWKSYQKCSLESFESWGFSGKLYQLKIYLFVFWLVFDCPMDIFRPLLRGQPRSPDVNYCVFTYFTQMSSGAL